MMAEAIIIAASPKEDLHSEGNKRKPSTKYDKIATFRSIVKGRSGSQMRDSSMRCGGMKKWGGGIFEASS